MDVSAIQPTVAVQVIAGATIALLGRRLFWLCVGAAGFLAGSLLGAAFQDQLETWAIIALSVGLGVVGMALALFLQRLAIIASGALAGGFIAATLAQLANNGAQEVLWLYFLVGGVLGGVLVTYVFEWSLILLSAGAGAILIADSAPISPSYYPLAVLIGAVAGFAFQAQQLKKAGVAPPKK